MRGAVGWLKVRLAAFFSWLMRTGPARRLLLPHMAPMQMWLFRRTGGRFQLSALLLPSLVLITTGAKSGLRRETPLMCLPRPDGSFLVGGSNWGQPHHPAWTANLLAHPDAEVIFRRRTVGVRARLLAGHERETAWTLFETQFPGYRRYETAANRRIRIFSLEPRAQAGLASSAR
jgi:deazaflavin-dependent oxidoreductase (nitroreductase family)